MLEFDKTFSFRELNKQTNGTGDYLVLLFDILSPVDFPDDYWQAKYVDVDWDKLFIFATDSFTAPLLYQRLLQRNLNWVSDEFLDSLEVIYTLNKQRNNQLKEILIESIRILNKGGIKPTLLKGANALFGFLPNADCRMMGDLDLLIPQEQLLHGRELLFAKGYYHDGLFKSNNDEAIKPEHNHIAPLFHPSAYGYLELHRYPNYMPKHPALVERCFQQDNYILNTKEGCDFYILMTESLYLYNQVHHYYSSLGKYSCADIRYLIEQSFLLETMGTEGLKKVSALINETDKSFEPAFLLQNALIADLFSYPLVNNCKQLDRTNKEYLKKVYGILMNDKRAMRELKSNIFKEVITTKRNLNFRWFKDRLFNRKYIIFTVKRYWRIFKKGRL